MKFSLRARRAWQSRGIVAAFARTQRRCVFFSTNSPCSLEIASAAASQRQRGWLSSRTSERSELVEKKMKFSLRARRAWRSRGIVAGCARTQRRCVFFSTLRCGSRTQRRCVFFSTSSPCSLEIASLTSFARNDNKGIDTSLRCASLASKTVNKECHREESLTLVKGEWTTWRSRSASKNVPWDCFGLRPRNDTFFSTPLFASLPFNVIR